VIVRAAMLSLFALAATGAGAAELRPLDQKELCLDGGTEVRPGINRVQLAECNDSDGQNFRRGKLNTIYISQLCLQAVSVTGAEKIEVAAMRCHGRDGQRWAMTRDGRLTSGDKLCLTVEGKGPSAGLAMTPCKEPPADLSDQKWAIYGNFD
jgi:hypothetical protein